MRRLLLPLAMLGMFLGLPFVHANAAPAAAGVRAAPGSLVVQADYRWNRKHWRHRRWEHHRWHYYN